ncbi:Oidioi.mRNA.OKI2018_I69.PAR.g11718.t1.cds [Oikopleura dioica]|uniref:Oidioi.mRNA.OKI2018_I69.PAR.g11718.t1.cds n=1 Tax=Oikopleura dioica TaxID=34765 RepID=A0ABN7RX41_OIKDI|nr:Oidioi.mRNA.OKI2018_I69.PAR.g11718.t1.cds [Oikopleura dioica]
MPRSDSSNSFEYRAGPNHRPSNRPQRERTYDTIDEVNPRKPPRPSKPPSITSSNRSKPTHDVHSWGRTKNSTPPSNASSFSHHENVRTTEGGLSRQSTLNIRSEISRIRAELRQLEMDDSRSPSEMAELTSHYELQLRKMVHEQIPENSSIHEFIHPEDTIRPPSRPVKNRAPPPPNQAPSIVSRSSKISNRRAEIVDRPTPKVRSRQSSSQPMPQQSSTQARRRKKPKDEFEDLPPATGRPWIDAAGIERMAEEDDGEDWSHFKDFVMDDTPAPEASIPVPKVQYKPTNYIYQFLYILYLISLLAYIYVRLTFTLDAPGLNRIYCCLVAILEISTCPSLIIQGMTMWKWTSREEPSLAAFERPKFHTIRVMIPTYNEPLEVVAGTLHEVMHMDVPTGLHLHIYVLDDGKRGNLEEYILGRRTKRNINHTLRFIYDYADAKGEAVVVFDADFMPRRNYLWRVLPVFSEKRDRPIGLVQTPQFFYNVNADEDVWDHLNVSFFHRIEPSLDQWSAVNCCGTNFTVRADALKSVGVCFYFLIYYTVGNLLLLYPPPGFQIKDMWNGELASTNLWYTYFNGVRRIVGVKLTQGRGELTFKATKKKAEGDEDNDSGVGFQKEDVRACYMHFIMFFLMLITILYAIIKAIIARSVKFYYYYMYMIGMGWSLINIIPYLIVVIYCWYRTRIPGIMCAILRNVQLLLRGACAILLLIQAFTTRNLTEKFVCPHPYSATIGIDRLTMIRTLDDVTGKEIERNTFWLLGMKDDFYTIQQIKQSACEDSSVPVVVFYMAPRTGLVLDEQASHYMPPDRLPTWEEYDAKIEEYGEALADVPLMLILEPSFLMHTFNSENEYHAADHQLSFTQRVDKIIRRFPKAWTYVDAGNALYLQWAVNMDHIVDVLQQMPVGLRGFAMNVGSFVNSTYNMQLAAELHCQTGLNYVIDTSRNGGIFSDRSMDEINECTYDPPYISRGAIPGYGPGAKKAINRVDNDLKIDSDYEDYYGDYYYSEYYRKRRSTEPSQNRYRRQEYEYDSYGYDYYADYDPAVLECLSSEIEKGHDANSWVKTPGEGDGRLFASGTYHECLLEHTIECSDTCPAYVPKINGEFAREKTCTCNPDELEDYSYDDSED